MSSKPQGHCSPVQEVQLQEYKLLRGIGARNRADRQMKEQLLEKYILLWQQVEPDKWIHGSNLALSVLGFLVQRLVNKTILCYCQLLVHF